VQTVTGATLDFLLERAKVRESIFFVSKGSVTPLFQSVLESITKVTQEKLRLPICRLLGDVADIMIELFPKGSCLSGAFAGTLDVLIKQWFKKPVELQNEILLVVGKLSCAIGAQNLIANADKICGFLGDSVGRAGLKFSAVAGLGSALSQIELLSTVPKMQPIPLITKLYDFVESEYPNMKTDGTTMKAVNRAVGALGSLMTTFPTAPLDAILKKLPATAALYTLNLFCGSFAQSEFALAIASGLASARFPLWSPPQKAFYSTCFMSLLRQCAVAAPDFVDIFRNVIHFIANGGDEETATALVALAEQNTHVFPMLSPAVFQFLLNPLFLSAVPTLVGITVAMKPHIVRTLRQIQQANLDLVEITGILLIFYFADMFKAEAKRKIAVIVAALVGIESYEDLVAAVCEARKADGWAIKLLDTTRRHVAHFVNLGGEKPVLIPQSRAVLRGAVAQLVGHLVKTPELTEQLEAIHNEVLGRLDPTSITESQGVGRFIGLASAVNVEFETKFLSAEIDTLAVNIQQRFKFWKKKGKTFLSVPAAVLATAFVLDFAPTETPQINSIFKVCATDFLKEEDVPERCRLQLMRSAFGRAGRDPNLDVSDGAGFVRHAVGVLKTFTDVFEHYDAVRVLSSAFRAAPTLIPAPDVLLGDVLEIVRTAKLSGSELVRLFESVSELIEVIIRQKQLTSPDLLFTFHQTCLRYVKVSRLALPFLEAIRRIILAYASLNDEPTRILQVSAVYIIISLVAPYNEIGQEIALGLITRLHPGEYDISNAAAAAEVLFGFEGSDMRQAMLKVPVLFAQDAGAFLSAGESLLAAFASTTYARSNPADLAHMFLQISGPVSSPLVKLVELDSVSVLNRLLSEPLDATVASAFQTCLSSERVKSVTLHHLLYCEQSQVEAALTVLRDSTVPFAGNSEEVYVRLAVLILRFQQPEFTNIICDIFTKHVTNPSAFEVMGTARESLLVSTDSLGVRLLFDDLALHPETDYAKLLELATSVVADGTTESSIVSAVICGNILASAQSPNTAHAVVDLLISESQVDSVTTERLRALGGLAQAAPEARTSEGLRVMNFLIAQGPSVLAFASLAKIVPIAGDDSLFAVNERLLSLLQSVFEAGTELLMPSALRILTAVVGSRRLATYTRATDVFVALFPLVIAATFAFDRDATAPSMLAICRRIGVPPLVQAERATDFVDANIGVLIKAIKDIDAFVTQLEKATTRDNPRVKAGVCYLLASLAARDRRRLDSRRGELVKTVVACMGADAEVVRLGAARAFGVLLE
jgi:hypothetical protein